MSQKIRVLVVDDHPVNRDVLLRQLAMLGVEADAADTGEDGLGHPDPFRIDGERARLGPRKVEQIVMQPYLQKFAAYYYNRALQWGKGVAISTKFHAFLAGGITDHERMMRAPVLLQDNPWLVHDTIGSTWGYTEGMRIGSPGGFIRTLVDVVSKNGIFLLNVSPKGDGSIPDDQRRVLLAIGGWLQANGEAIYGTHVWKLAGEGQLQIPRGQAATGRDIRFTTKGDTLYAILLAWPGAKAVITSIVPGGIAGAVEKVELLGSPGALTFSQGADGLSVQLPVEKPNDYAFVLRITGLKLK